MSDKVRKLKEEMIQVYGLKCWINELWIPNKKNILTYHHILEARNGGKATIENGSILRQDTSHDYLHKIELTDREIFELITDRMIEMNRNGKLDLENLKIIRDLLLYFEREHDHDKLSSGKLLIKREYVRERIVL